VLRQFPHAIGWTCASGSDLRWVTLKLNPQPRHRSTMVTACSYPATHESCLGRPDHAVLGATVAGKPTSHGPQYGRIFGSTPPLLHAVKRGPYRWITPCRAAGCLPGLAGLSPQRVFDLENDDGSCRAGTGWQTGTGAGDPCGWRPRRTDQPRDRAGQPEGKACRDGFTGQQWAGLPAVGCRSIALLKRDPTKTTFLVRDCDDRCFDAHCRDLRAAVQYCLLSQLLRPVVRRVRSG
jgi:hypothetical protein